MLALEVVTHLRHCHPFHTFMLIDVLDQSSLGQRLSRL